MPIKRKLVALFGAAALLASVSSVAFAAPTPVQENPFAQSNSSRYAKGTNIPQWLMKMNGEPTGSHTWAYKPPPPVTR